MTNQEKLDIAYRLILEVFLEVETKPEFPLYVFQSMDKVLDDLDYIKREFE